ncbi:MAG: VWA domain-containing protein [Bdellovibrionales bacterium]|nr:VWA domain-containing protein [Bdellovibrionales bacterium]
MTRVLPTFILLMAVAVATACSDVRLKGPPGPGPANAQGKGLFCVNPPVEVNRFTKILFIVDKSYSNTEVYLPDGGTLPGTDPGGGKRAGAIERFINLNASKKHFRYGLVGFQEAYGQSYVNDPVTKRAGYSGDIPSVLDSVKRMQNTDDSGETPYIEALEEGIKVVKNDIDSHPDEESDYFVLFLSDGIPTVGQEDSTIFGLINQLKSLSPTLVVSTAFYGDYGKYTQDAKNRLKEMARLGGGKFLDFNQSTEWHFEDFFEKPGYEPWFLSQFMVYNLNAAFCLDGFVDTDSDVDGMCDRDELALATEGFDPTNRFTFGDGYGDFFHWRSKKLNSPLPPCQDRSDEDHDLLTFCEEKFIKNDNARADIGKVGNPKLFDTDRDGIIDGIETFVYFPRLLAFAMDDENLNGNFDGEEPAGFQIAQHRSPLRVDAQDGLSYDGKLEPVTSAFPACYNYSQRRLPLYPTLPVAEGKTLPGLEHGAQENVVLIYYIQKLQKRPREDGVLKYSYQLLRNDPVRMDHNQYAGLLDITDKVFKTYIPPSEKK